MDDLIAAAANSRTTTASASAPAAAHGLKLDLKLLDGNAVELSGDVVVTTDGMAVTPSGMGFTPINGAPGGSALVSPAGDDDWFATYSASAGGRRDAAGERGPPSGGALEGVRRSEEMAGLSPLLTPSNNKLCAALVDAF